MARTFAFEAVDVGSIIIGSIHTNDSQNIVFSAHLSNVWHEEGVEKERNHLVPPKNPFPGVAFTA